MTLSELDKRLMELLTLQVPWYMVCGEFHEEYGGPQALAARLAEMEHEELIVIRDTQTRGVPVSADVLANDALANDCYESLEETREPRWDVVATDAGFKLVEDRLGRQ
jgi:hypothetical protein